MEVIILWLVSFIPFCLILLCTYIIFKNNKYTNEFENLKDKYNVEYYYEGRDKSHSIEHIERVFSWLKIILKSLSKSKLNCNEELICKISVLFHDAYDHKYIPKNTNQQEWIINIKKKINEEVGVDLSNKDKKLVHRIIDNISFSKEKKKRGERVMFDFKLMNIHNNIKQNDKEEFLRNIVSDADKLDSLGTEAIERMYYYQEHSITEEKYTNKWFENHITHIKTHCQEKLYILLSHNYIKTVTGRKIAIDLLKEMKEIVEDNDKLVDFIREL